MEYVVTVEPDSPGVLLLCPEVPEFHAGGPDLEFALKHAPEAMITTMMIYMDERRPIPLPRRARKGETTVAIPAQAQAKAQLYNAMLEQDVNKAEMKRRLGLSSSQVERLLDMRHASKLEVIEEAAKALGLRVDLRLV